MAKMKFSTKQLMINKANAQMVIMIGAASALVVFSLIASKSLLSQRTYQSRIITKKEKALKQLKSNVDAVKTLVSAYNQFENANENVIGGNPKGSGDRDGDNAKIVLDALPSQYDFPALATSLEKLVTAYKIQSLKIESITGTDDELNQQKSPDTATPAPVDMPFSLSVSGTYAAIQSFVSTLERSIRPIQVLGITYSGKDADLKAEISAKTFYQPEKSLTIKTEEITR